MSDHDLSAKLPPPHDEEPAQLRSDILDELRDHLDCAVDRERRRLEVSGQPADAKTVWQLVIERFGDPASVARRLWFDAMKGRIMTQRVMLGAVAVAVIALVGWMTVLSRSLTAVIDENQKATAAVLERLGMEPAERPAEVSQEMSAVKFTLVRAGVPVVGTVVHFDQHPGEEPLRLGTLTETTNAKGVADFGVLPYGIYDLTIDSDAGTLTEQVTLRPGRPIEMRIVVPEPQPLGQVKFEFTPPEWAKWEWTTEDRKPPTGEPVLLVRYMHHSEVEFDKRTWKGPEETKSVVVRADGIYTNLIEVVGSEHSLVQFGQGGASLDDMEIDNAERLIEITSRVETLSLPKGPLKLTAEWLHVVEHAAGTGEGRILVRPVVHSLNLEYARAMLASLKLDRHKFPLLLDIDPTTPQPQIIRYPANDPSTFDGEETPPLYPSGRGGGGHGFF